jgi:hypothetical protein
MFFDRRDNLFFGPAPEGKAGSQHKKGAARHEYRAAPFALKLCYRLIGL